MIPDVFYNLGIVFETTGRAAEALDAYRRFVELAGPDRRAEAEAVRARFGW